jgi:2,3-dihydroxy-p-cumate/2,3-dihydroxybenzoate 3,4-dioxygenase
VRLSHVVLHAADVAASAAFYERTLGLRTSDWLAQFMCFLRCDTAHHRLALLPGLPNLNHIAFDVQNVDELMRGISRLSMAGIKLEWGPGRHTAGANIFAYFRTPSGVTLEYTAELEQVNEDTWQPTVYPLTPEITDQWGTGRLFIDSSPQFPQQPDPGLWTPPPC